MEVKLWQPAEGCKACKNADRIMQDQTRHQMERHGAVLKLRKADLARIKELKDPSFEKYINITKQFLTHYPDDIFDGSSGDKGPLFIVALRKALVELEKEDG